MTIQRVEEDYDSSWLGVGLRAPSVSHEFESVIIPVFAFWKEGDVLG